MLGVGGLLVEVVSGLFMGALGSSDSLGALGSLEFSGGVGSVDSFSGMLGFSGLIYLKEENYFSCSCCWSSSTASSLSSSLGFSDFFLPKSLYHLLIKDKQY